MIVKWKGKKENEEWERKEQIMAKSIDSSTKMQQFKFWLCHLLYISSHLIFLCLSFLFVKWENGITYHIDGFSYYYNFDLLSFLFYKHLNYWCTEQLLCSFIVFLFHEKYLFSSCVCGIFLKHKLTVDVWILFLAFYRVIDISMYIMLFWLL